MSFNKHIENNYRNKVLLRLKKIEQLKTKDLRLEEDTFDWLSSEIAKIKPKTVGEVVEEKGYDKSKYEDLDKYSMLSVIEGLENSWLAPFWHWYEKYKWGTGERFGRVISTKYNKLVPFIPAAYKEHLGINYEDWFISDKQLFFKFFHLDDRYLGIRFAAKWRGTFAKTLNIYSSKLEGTLPIWKGEVVDPTSHLAQVHGIPFSFNGTIMHLDEIIPEYLDQITFSNRQQIEESEVYHPEEAADVIHNLEEIWLTNYYLTRMVVGAWLFHPSQYHDLMIINPWNMDSSSEKLVPIKWNRKKVEKEPKVERELAQ